MDISEKDVEEYFVRRCASHGMLAVKFLSPGYAGVPDRLVLMPHRRIVFVELKAPGKKARPLQLAFFRLLARFGHTVSVLDTKEAVDDWMEREVMPYEVHST